MHFDTDINNKIKSIKEAPRQHLKNRAFVTGVSTNRGLTKVTRHSLGMSLCNVNRVLGLASKIQG
jgi:hypothetical protein